MTKRYRKTDEFDTKADKARAERESRIEALRAKDGSLKAATRKKSKRRKNFLTILISILLVLILSLIIAWQTGFVHRRVTAINVANNEVSINEYNYAYFSIYNIYNRYFGKGGLLNLKADSSAYTKQNKTWGEFFTDTAMENVQQSSLTYGKAVADGYSISEEDRARVKLEIDSLQKQIGTPVDFELYLRNVFGNGMTVKAYEDILLKEAVAKRYAAAQPATYEIESTEINKYYDEHKDDYDIVSYHSFILKNIEKDKADSKDKNKNDENSKEKESKKDDDKVDDSEKNKEDKTESIAKEILEKLDSADKVKKVAVEYAATDEDKKKYESEDDVTLHKDTTKASINNEELSKWLFEKNRKSGDKTYKKVSEGYEIIYFVSRNKDQRPTADARIIAYNLFDKNGEKKNDKTIELIKNKSKELAASIKSEEDILLEDKKIKDGNGDKFASESVRHDNINGSNESGLNAKVLEYVLSSDSKKGDTNVVETSGIIYLVHIIEKHDTETWNYLIKDNLQKTKYNEDFDAMLAAEENKPKKVYPGYYFIKKA